MKTFLIIHAGLRNRAGADAARSQESAPPAAKKGCSGCGRARIC